MAEYKINYTQSNFTGGIVSAELYGRNDYNKVKAGAKQLTNWTVREAGGLEFRRGTKHLVDITSEFGANFKLASLGEKLIIFGTDKARWLNGTSLTAVSSYINPSDFNHLMFQELQQKLYYYDGSMKLSEIYLDGSTVKARNSIYEKPLSGATLQMEWRLEENADEPDPRVPVTYSYAMAIASDELHESIAFIANKKKEKGGPVTNGSEVSANSELGVEYIHLACTVPVADVNAALAKNPKAKLMIYKRYQGRYYFLSAIQLTAGNGNYTYDDKGEYTTDVSKTIKQQPPYLNNDGTVTGVISLADYNQRIFMTFANLPYTIVYTGIGNFDSLAYSELRNEDEAGHKEIPITHFDDWCKVVSGLDLIFSTSYSISSIQGAGDLQLQTVLFDGFSKTVQPVATRRSLIYTNSSNRNIYDLSYNEYGQYDGIDLTLLVKYIFEKKTIKRIAFKDYPVKTIYVLCDDGDLYCLTYIKDQNIYAWYKLQHQGTIKDIVVINKETEDTIYLAVQYGNNYVIEEAYLRTDSVYLDCAVSIDKSNIGNPITINLRNWGEYYTAVDSPTSANGVYYGNGTISNLPIVRVENNKLILKDGREYERNPDRDKTVTVYPITGLPMALWGYRVRIFDLANNRYYGDYNIKEPKTVEECGNIVQTEDTVNDTFYPVQPDGSIRVDAETARQLSEDPSKKMLIGLPYYAVLETIPLEFSDSNGNSTIGRTKTLTHAYLRYGDSRGLTYKTLGKEYDCGICKKDVVDNAQFLERGQVKLDTASEYKWDSTIKILQRQPYPARVESITIGLRFNDPS